MTWILWALMLITHGGYRRWAKTSRFYAAASIIGDGLLLAIGLITIERIEGMSLLEIFRVGVFFTAFAVAGQQLVHSVLARYSDKGGGRPDVTA
jgi:hypothetical protein